MSIFTRRPLLMHSPYTVIDTFGTSWHNSISTVDSGPGITSDQNLTSVFTCWLSLLYAVWVCKNANGTRMHPMATYWSFYLLSVGNRLEYKKHKWVITETSKTFHHLLILMVKKILFAQRDNNKSLFAEGTRDQNNYGHQWWKVEQDKMR